MGYVIVKHRHQLLFEMFKSIIVINNKSCNIMQIKKEIKTCLRHQMQYLIKKPDIHKLKVGIFRKKKNTSIHSHQVRFKNNFGN